MIINNKSWEKLKEYVDNLYWDEDRMSSDGVHFLNKLDNEIKQIEKNSKNTKDYDTWSVDEKI